MHVHPERHVPDLPALDGAERDALARLLRDVLGRLDGVFDRPMPYVAAWHQATVRRDRDLAHLRLELTSPRRAADRLKYPAGNESAAGAWLNDVAPERAAELLRGA